MFSMEDFESGSGSYSDGGIRKASIMEEEDLQEDEVWSVMKKTTEGLKSNLNSKPRKKVSAVLAISSRGRGSQAEDSAVDFVSQHSSAPVDIPDNWSNILKMKSKQNYLHLWDDDDGGRSKTHHDVKNDDDDDANMVPPHEYLARKLESTQMASFQCVKELVGL